MAKIIEVEGIGPKYAEKLQAAGVKTTEALLKVGGTPKGREELSAKAETDKTLILEWVNRVDLFRVKGIGSEYSDLLESSGVDSVVELGKRKAANLYAKMMEVNTAKKLVRRPPSEKMVEDWIEQAKTLPRAISY